MTKISPDGKRLVFSTLVGGADGEFFLMPTPDTQGNGVITLYGANFNYPYGRIEHREGTLSDILANGDPINAAFEIYGDASIVLVPEPPTFLLLRIAALALVTYAWRRRRRA